MLAAGGTLASPVRALSLAVPAPEKAYAAFFLGQGGYLFSWGIPYLASQARELGMETDIFGYSDVGTAWRKISRKKQDGYKIALVGYSLGNTCGSEVQSQCVVCRRWVVSAVPSSPDCTTNASKPATRHKRNKGLLSQTVSREVIVRMLIHVARAPTPTTVVDWKQRSNTRHSSEFS